MPLKLEDAKSRQFGSDLAGRKTCQLIDELCKSELERVFNVLGQINTVALVELEGYVCSVCMKPVLSGNILSRTHFSIPKHSCDLGWLFDSLFLSKYSDILTKYLEGKIPEMILKVLLKIHRGDLFLSVQAIEDPLSYSAQSTYETIFYVS